MAFIGHRLGDNFDPCFYLSDTRKGRRNANMRISFSGEVGGKEGDMGRFSGRGIGRLYGERGSGVPFPQ